MIWGYNYFGNTHIASHWLLGNAFACQGQGPQVWTWRPIECVFPSRCWIMGRLFHGKSESTSILRGGSFCYILGSLGDEWYMSTTGLEIPSSINTWDRSFLNDWIETLKSNHRGLAWQIDLQMRRIFVAVSVRSREATFPKKIDMLCSYVLVFDCHAINKGI